jgi:hypothetical protein
MTEEERPLAGGEAEALIAAGQEEELPEEVEVEERLERMPPETSGLTDEEIEEYIRAQLTGDGGVDLDELEITCRRGVIYLDGALPSEERHQIVLQYITDFAGIQAVVDRLAIDELLWEREDRTDTPEDTETSSGPCRGRWRTSSRAIKKTESTSPRRGQFRRKPEPEGAILRVRPEGIEPPTSWFEARRSVRLSYGRTLGTWTSRRNSRKTVGIYHDGHKSCKVFPLWVVS